ncbi:unnamed protein product [Ectocarpus sp. CCAP 1310/34]|nr:unnamed protein product [Ectocarpus sp. CCAP 1310/34]
MAPPAGRGGGGARGHRAPGGFRGGAPRPPPPRPPAPAGQFFGGPGVRARYGGGHGGTRGPLGTTCCCWVVLCTAAFVIVVTVGIMLIESLEECSTSTSDSENSNCIAYEVGLAVGAGVVVLCCCCCCMRPSEEGYQPIDGSASERQYMLATEAPLPQYVHGN